MNRFVVITLCLSTSLFVGCLRTTESRQVTAQVLTPIYTEDHSSVIQSLAYSDNGATLVTSGGCCVNLYNTLDYSKLVALKREDFYKIEKNDRPPLAGFNGAGYIDRNTWYFFSSANATDNDVIDIRQLEPARELIKHNLKVNSNRPVFANKHHLANGRTMLDWRSGKRYEIVTEVGEFGYTLTENSHVMTHNPLISDHVLIHDPVKQESLWIDTGSRVFNTAISADAKYVVTISRRNKCVLWQLPEQTRLGSCGSARLLNPKQTFRSDGRSFMVWGNNEIREYTLPPSKTLQPIRRIPIKITMPDQILDSAQNDNWLAVVDEKSNLRVWSLADGSLRGEYANPVMADYRISASSANLVLQPGGTHLAVSQSSWLMVFDLAILSAQNDSSVRN